MQSYFAGQKIHLIPSISEILFIGPSVIIWVQFYFASTSLHEVCLSHHVIYSWAGLHYANFGKNYASMVNFGSNDAIWYTEHNFTTFVTISPILIEWSKFFMVVLADYISFMAIANYVMAQDNFRSSHRLTSVGVYLPSIFSLSQRDGILVNMPKSSG